jgi:hypothetical protein
MRKSNIHRKQLRLAMLVLCNTPDDRARSSGGLAWAWRAIRASEAPFSGMFTPMHQSQWVEWVAWFDPAPPTHTGFKPIPGTGFSCSLSTVAEWRYGSFHAGTPPSLDPTRSAPSLSNAFRVTDAAARAGSADCRPGAYGLATTPAYVVGTQLEPTNQQPVGHCMNQRHE